jgi:uncharacterized metal-binding protein
VPSGATHAAAAASAAVAFILGVVVNYTFGLLCSVVGVSSFLLGEFLLSPDLDHSAGARPYRRWGPLRVVWRPYQWLVPHRGVLSHCPVVGTATRVVYTCVLFLAVWYVLVWLGRAEWGTIDMWVRSNRGVLVSALVGAELSTDLHVTLDHFMRGE